MNGSGKSKQCEVCGSALKRNGKTSAGTQRWRCIHCGASSVKKRPDLKRRAELNLFLQWILGKQSQASYNPGTGRTLRHNTQWCWAIEPSLAPTGEVHLQIQMDGIYLGRGWCCLIAIANGKTIGWQWCDSEKRVAWIALLEQFPAPRVVIIDGGSGLAAALSQAWPETRVQRCLVHVQRNVRTYLTLRPRTDAGRALRRISLALTRIKTREHATQWMQALQEWHHTFGDVIKERTYPAGPGGHRPKGVKPTQTWWYTHTRLRSAYKLLERLVRSGELFTYLEPEFDGLAIASTTNHIEGGVNTQLRALLRGHRGMPPAHAKRAVEWWLYSHSEKPTEPHTLIRPEHLNTKPVKKQIQEETIGPELIGTALTEAEGLWVRKGWAGRPC
ncbi:IS1249 family transposase [Paeniglutamicibacter sp. Y32M11]|uniref:IS1249 family transposase n=1 Tax=Paeniglutamicibacter sp. Y32M11 TaxID=2853258 RepID=UPI001C52ADAA|nr:IS1249 family transposase [Paeniglutamicibacter sp. Y32M11]QXQ09346.1 IS1249 family transposase [Paeniglutamicibacter sp. Y32M11]